MSFLISSNFVETSIYLFYDGMISLIVNVHLSQLQHLRAQNEDLKAQLENLETKLNEKGEELHQLESLNQTLISSERSSNEELKAGRTEAIKV